MKPLVTMRGALADPDLFGPLMAGETWSAWRVMLVAIFGEELTDDERRIFQSLTLRSAEPRQLVECMVAVVGRRGGKSRAAAIIAVYIACLCDHAGKIVVGERPVVLCLAQNQKQAGITFGYIGGIIENVAALARMVTNKTADSLTLSNGVSIEVRPASFRGLRGVTALAVIADETCFWYADETSANADTEILNAVRPSLATTGGPLVLISSPYAKKGETYSLYQRHFGPNGDPLIVVAQGASRDFNPSLPQRIVDRAIEADPEAAAAEYLGQWRNDLAPYVTRETVERCVDLGCFERPCVASFSGPVLNYVAFADAASGSGRDSAAFAIAHAEGDLIVLDCVREIRPPFSPDSAIDEMVQALRSYGLNEVTGDRWATGFVAESFSRRGVIYQTSERTKSDLYRELLPMLNGGKVALLDNKRLVAQLCSLERRVARSGRDSIDAGQGAPEDLANAAAGALVGASAIGSGFNVAQFIAAYG